MRVVRHGRGEREELVVYLGKVVLQLRDVRFESLRLLQRGSPGFFFLADAAAAAASGLADPVADERLRVARPVQDVRELFVPVVQPLYRLDRADGEGRLAVEGVVRFVHCVFGDRAVVQARFWQRGRGGAGGFRGAVAHGDGCITVEVEGRW